MASPVITDTAGINITTAADPVSVTWPGAITAGMLMLMAFRTPGAVTCNGATGWTFLLNNNTADATDDVTSVLYRRADGTEASSISVDFSAVTKVAGCVCRISGAENPATQAPEIGTIATGTTGANVGNPGAITPTGGSKDYLFIATLGLDGEGNQRTADPAGYAVVNEGTTGISGAVATNCVFSACQKSTTAASEDPGAYTHPTANAGWTAFTIAVHPVATAAPGPASSRRQRRASRYLTFR